MISYNLFQIAIKIINIAVSLQQDTDVGYHGTEGNLDTLEEESMEDKPCSGEKRYLPESHAARLARYFNHTMRR